MARVGRLLTLLAFLVAPARPAGATFHFMSISELGAGFLDDPNAQFVELRLDAPDQTNLATTRLTAFDKDGIPTVLLETPSGVGDGTSGRNVLYATQSFATATGLTPDFVIPPGVLEPSGMICWGAPPDAMQHPEDPATWDLDKPNNYINCVAYGSYAHATRTSSGTPSALTPGDGVRSLTRIKNTSASGSNDMDFELATAHPCNNAGQCADLAPHASPTATATPSPKPTPAADKADIACRRAVIKAGTKFAAAYLQAESGCETLRLKGKVTGPCPDTKASAKIASADAKRTKAVLKACGALTPADAGFDVSCPGYTGACTAAITTVADASACVDCAARRAADELVATIYAAPADAAFVKCQVGLGKAVTSHARAVAALLAACEDGRARGKIAGTCPDAKTALKVAAKNAKLHATLCRACGGKDKQCGGDDDAPPATLGVTTCPSRSVPGGADCATIATGDLAGVAACAECVSRFTSTCTTALVAAPSALPAACAAP